MRSWLGLLSQGSPPTWVRASLPSEIWSWQKQQWARDQMLGKKWGLRSGKGNLLSLWSSIEAPLPSLLLSLAISPDVHGRHMRKLNFGWEAELTWLTDVVHIIFWSGWEGKKSISTWRWASGASHSLGYSNPVWYLTLFSLILSNISQIEKSQVHGSKTSFWNLVLSPASWTSRPYIPFVFMETKPHK